MFDWMKFRCIFAGGQYAGVMFPAVCMSTNCCIMCAWSSLRLVSLAAICWIEALKTAVLASFDTEDCVKTDADRLAMWELIVLTIVSPVPLSDTSSSVDSPTKRLTVLYLLEEAVTVPDVRRR
jgi:hypothetical protein